MQALQVPAKHGFAWIVEGYRLFARSPLLLVMLILGYMFILVASNIVPVVGPLAVVLVTPAFLAGLMAACRALEQGQAAEMKNLFAGFGTNFPTLLRLGVAFLAAAVAILAITALVDGGKLMQLGLPGAEPAEDFVVDDKLIWALNLASLLFFPVLIVFFFASMLAAWHGIPALKGLFFSCFAGVRNIRAFLLYALLLLVLNSLVPALIFALLVTLFDAQGATFALVVLMPASFVLMAIMLASVYAGYRDIFRDNAADDPAVVLSQS
jgi:hypothetical protein